jgi:damage-control phosphatase, subfamily I
VKTAVDCLPCFLRQALQVARIARCSPEVTARVVQATAGLLATLDLEDSPPANAEAIYATISAISGCDDPYAAIKQRSNDMALRDVAEIEAEHAQGEIPFSLALRLAIAGNAIDYGAFAEIEVAGALAGCRTAPLAVDHRDMLEQRLNSLKNGHRVLYLADNCGEIVYDRLLLGHLFARGLEITVAVKDGPIINDALHVDAVAAGLERYARIVSNGSRCPGTVLHRCSPEFRRLFDEAELVLAKGQGNFESLAETDREVFFLLLLKCPVAAAHMARLLGGDAAALRGRGEMAIYCSTMSKFR